MSKIILNNIVVTKKKKRRGEEKKIPAWLYMHSHTAERINRVRNYFVH